MANEKVQNRSIGFCGLLAIVFIVLKLTNVIAWSWAWILSPIWMPWAIAIVAIVVYFIYILITQR